MDLLKLGLLLIFAGIIITFLAILLPLLLTTPESTSTSVTGGGCIMIFFIPICFGIGEQAHLALLLAVILSIILVVILILLHTWILKPLKKAISTPLA